MAGGSIGYATLPVVPSFRGFGPSLAKQISAPVRAAGASAGAAGGAAAGGGFTKGLGRALGGVGKAAAVTVGAGLAVGVGAVGVLAGTAFSKGLDRAISIQNAQAKLTGLGHSTASVTKIMDNALASVKGTAFGLGDAAGVAAGAVAAGIKPGMQLQRTLSLVADSATIAGSDMGSMGSIFNKVAASGKLQGDVIAQLQDAGVPVLQFVAKQIGKTAAETAALASDGKIDFQTFSDAMQAGLGGAALASGKTAQGAFANVQAALGRIGAGFLSGPVANAPVLFTSFGGAVDRLGVSLKPVMAQFDVFSGTQMTALAKRIDGIQFDGIVGKARTMAGGVIAVLKTVTTGAGFDLDLTRAFGLDKAPLVWSIASHTHDVLAGAFDVAKILGGDSSDATAVDLSKRFGLNAAPTIYAAASSIHKAIAGIFTGVKTGDFSGVGSSLLAIGSAAKPALPILVAVGPALGKIAGSVGQTLASGIALLPPILSVFTTALGFLADHAELVAPLVVAIAGAFLLFRGAQAAANAAELGALPIRAANVLALFAQANANRALATQMAIANGQTVASRAAMLPATAQVILNTGAMIAQRVAMVASRVAMGVATAAQWAWNAAMSANPIGLVVLALVALVGGLVWFFTQTKLGQGIWSGFVGFLVGAWQTIQAVGLAVFTGIGNFVIGVWTWIQTATTTAWSVITTLIDVGVNAARAVVLSVIAGLAAGWQATWSAVSAVASATWSAIVGFVTAYVNNVRAVVLAVVSAVRAGWSAGLSAMSAVARTIWSAITGTVRSAVSGVQGVVSGAINYLRGIWSAGWSIISGAVSTAAGAIKGIVGGLVSSVRGSIDGVVSVFRSVKGTITGLFASAGSWLSDVGGHIISGFIGGIQAGWGRITSVVSGLVDKIPAVARKALGIASPSRVFRTIGNYVGQGLQQGLNGSVKGVQSASLKMSNAVGSAFESRQLSEAQAHGAYVAIAKANASLSNLAAARLSLANRLAAANKALAATQKQYNDYRSSVVQSVGTVDIAKAQTGAGIVGALRTQVADLKKFSTVMASLRKKGLDATSYQQLVAGGVDSLPLALNLLNGGTAQIKQVASLQNQLGKASSSFATSAANDLYGAGVNAAKGLVNGLKSQQGAIQKQMERISATMVSSVKRALGIHSPSRVFFGLGINTGAGYVNAVKTMIRPAQDALSRMVNPAGVDVPTLEVAGVRQYDAAVAAAAAARAATPVAAAASAGSGRSGPLVEFSGQVGFSPEALMREAMDRARQAQALENFDYAEVIA